MYKYLHIFSLCIFLIGVLAPSLGANAFELNNTFLEESECALDETKEEHVLHKMSHQHCNHCCHNHMLIAIVNDEHVFNQRSQLFPDFNHTILFDLLYGIKRPPRIAA